MDVADAYRHVINSYAGDVGRFYQPGAELAIGKGGVLRDAVFAAFDDHAGAYRTLAGVVYVLTHECDIDEANNRLFNTDLLVCPIIGLDDFVLEYSASLQDEQLVSFLGNLGARNISRLAYFPPAPEILPYGGILYLNQITHAPVEKIRSDATQLCSLTGYGLRELEYVLENHLLRPKADRLAFVPEGQAQLAADTHAPPEQPPS